jgi:hypothetical protein
VPEPVDPGPETQPSVEARPFELGPLDAYYPEPTKVPPEPVATAVDTGATPEPEAHPEGSPPSEPVSVLAQPVIVPGQYHYLKWWTLVLVLVGVWIPAALIGLALYYYWFHSLHKTPAVFVVLMVIVVCTVGAQLLAMVERKPLVTAVSIALMSAPLAATAAAAALYGAYAFHWISR